MEVGRRGLLLAGSGAVMGAAMRPARAQNGTIRIGVLTDMSGPYRDLTGPTSVACSRQAVAEFTAAHPEITVEILVADHKNDASLASGIVRQWFDRDGVDAVSNLGSSAVALACNSVVTEKNKVHLNTAGGTSALTGEACSPNLVHWTYDTWNIPHSIAASVVKAGGDSWYFVLPDYAFGYSLRDNTTKFVEGAGGKVVGSVAFPFPGTTDYSSYVLRAQSSGAKVVAFAAAGSDLVNCIKQAHEFGLGEKVTIVGLVGFITDFISMGLPLSQGLTVAENFYWDLNDRTRAWYGRVKTRLPAGIFPNMSQAGDYAGILHYLKTVKQIGVGTAKASGRETVAAMKALPTDDDCYGQGRIREDGRKIHPSYLFRVKTPEQSRGPGDVYELRSTIPAEEAFRPLGQGGCPMVKT